MLLHHHRSPPHADISPLPFGQTDLIGIGSRMALIVEVAGNAFATQAVMTEHDHLGFAIASSDEAHSQGGACEEDRCPDHDEADHDLHVSRTLSSAIAPVTISTDVVMVLLPQRPVVQKVDVHWRPKCSDGDRAPPGPSRAPPV